MFKFVIIFLISLIIFQPSYSQNKDAKFFEMDVLNFYSPEETNSRADIYLEVPFDKVTFKKSSADRNKYASEFNLTINVDDLSGNNVFNKTSSEIITTGNTDNDYLARNSQIITRNIYLEPGSYKLKAIMSEKNSGKSYEQTKEIRIKDFRSSPVTLSDIMLVSKVEEKNNRKLLTPLVSRNIGLIDTAYLFFFIYLNKTVPYMDVQAQVYNSKNEAIDSFMIPVNLLTGIAFENQIIYPIRTSRYISDNYSVKLNVKTDDYAATHAASFESKITDIPVDLDNIDYAVEQLQYIASEDEIEKIEKGASKAEKQKRFLEFWKTKDPSPGTEKNEVLTEYYNRIKYADKNYATNYTKGWKTDMGMIYIIFGLPNNVERHPYDMDSKPYEVWDYYELNRQFIFVDYSGFGDYRLITPIWETFKYR